MGWRHVTINTMAGGKLVFKGEKPKKKKSSTKIKSGGVESVEIAGNVAVGGIAESDTSQKCTDTGDAAANNDCTVDNKHSPEITTTQIIGPSINIGTGRISTSSTVVSGHGTSFKSQLRVGDAILAHTQKGDEEMRVVTMVLSNISASISSAFSSSISTPMPFKYISKPRDDKRDMATKMAKAKQEQEEVEQRAMGTYGEKGVITYRIKTEHGGYRIKKEEAKSDMTRSDLLSVRAQKKSDRYC